MHKDNTKKTNRDLLKRFLPYYRPYKKLFFSDMLASIFTIVSELTLPVIIGMITNRATSNTQSLDIKFILILALIYLGLKSIEIFASFSRRNFVGVGKNFSCFYNFI